MCPRIEQALHSIAAVILFVVVCVAVVAVGYWLDGLQGLHGKAFDSWMLWAAGIGMVVGFVTFFAYQRWVMPNRVRAMQGLVPTDSIASTLEHRRRVAEMAAHQDALRTTLRATPGLERYAELIGRSTIASLEDARQRAERVNELASDRVKAKYAERVFNGEVITDRQIAYWEDPAACVLCVHLAALETDVRAANPTAHPVADAVLESDRNLDFDALRKRYGLTDPPITFWHQPFGPEFYGRAEGDVRRPAEDSLHAARMRTARLLGAPADVPRRRVELAARVQRSVSQRRSRAGATCFVFAFRFLLSVADRVGRSKLRKDVDSSADGSLGGEGRHLW